MTGWTANRACSTADDVFFPTRDGDNGFAAKKVCAGCPVANDCLGYALGNLGDRCSGIFGGAGDAVRRMLRRLWRASAHEQPMADAACDCEFCAATRDHFARLETFASTGRQARGARALFGPGATHGRVATAKKGCTCRRCKLALAVSGKQARMSA